MKIKRFDETEYKAIQCGKSGGYYMEGSEEAKRAKLLMDEGIYKVNPKFNWHMTGWKFTKKGEKYYQEFMKKVQEKHGHVWITYKDRDPEFYSEDSKYGNDRDIFAFSEGYHNGPECKNCGFSFCQHCTSEMEISHCSNRK